MHYASAFILSFTLLCKNKTKLLTYVLVSAKKILGNAILHVLYFTLLCFVYSCHKYAGLQKQPNIHIKTHFATKIATIKCSLMSNHSLYVKCKALTFASISSPLER